MRIALECEGCTMEYYGRNQWGALYWLLDCSLQLATGGINVSPARAAQESWDSAVDQIFLKGRNIVGRWHAIGNIRSRIPDNQIHFRGQLCAAQQCDQLPRILHAIVHAAQQNILKGQTLARTQWDGSHRTQQILDLPFACDRHHALTDDIVGGIQAQREFGPYWLCLLYTSPSPRDRQK